MKKTTTLSFVYLSVLTVFISLNVTAQTVTNGSFTGPTGNSVTPTNWINALGHDPGNTIGGFPSVDVLDIAFSSYSGISTVPCVPSPDGGSWTGLSDLPAFNENEAIEQTITGFVIGQTYTISYYAANFGGSPFDDEGFVRAYLDGVQIASSPLLPLLANTWVPVSATFVATATSGVLQIDATTTSLPSAQGSYFSVDGVTITTSTPVLCNAGTTPPTLSQSSACVTGPFNLTNITASNTPAGTVLAWFSGTPASAANVITSPTNVGTGTYYGAFYDAVNNCFSPTSPVVLNPTPTANFSALSACLGLPNVFTDASTISSGSITQWNWDFGDGTNSTQQNSTHVYATQSSFTVTLTVVSNQGCTDVFSTTTSVISSPTASFGFSPTEPSIFDPTVTFINTSNNAGSVQWLFGDGASSTQENPTHTFDASPGSYTISLIIGSGTCSDTARATVLIKDILLYYVPNCFTPDGDEFNQTFQPVFTNGFDPFDYSFLIFNRWGEIVFESKDARVGWDGTYHGKIAQDGTYTWRIEFKLLESDERRVIHGSVLNMR